ncbi:kinesin-like protein KIF3A isoform X2 [Dreissena polymorpha]|nr:kinesin-like protein KIF3A isoform X2 [Dreissena polymorpha]
MPNIKTFCRIKPTEEAYNEMETTKTTLYLRVSEVLKDFGANQKGSRSFINHEFNFDHIFQQNASQQDIFDVAALDIVNGFLNGYNGTIFAYGQTGTGKTYTMEGSAKTYHSRGLEPRALSMIYQELEKRTTEDLSVHISYLEIYQDVGYDLLNPGARTQSFVTPFPKVNVIEGPNGSCVVRNQTNHLAASEDVAQSLLLQGQANRKVAATAVHDRSSRSHAVLTIQLSAKKMDSDTVVKSKLHLVDLAGSERVAKTRVLGQQLTEAKSINLSLHYLESVIVALQEEALNKEKVARTRTSVGSRKYYFSNRPTSADDIRGPRHVPYRNSLLTMLLRDSLGGNCMTSMIATISLEISNLGESISTCRFAGRVACIANAVSRNEELDEKSLIRKLRKRIAELETELACIKLDKVGDSDIRMQLTDADKELCVEVVNQYLSGKIADPISAGITDPHKFRECLRILKKVVSRAHKLDPNNNSPYRSGGEPELVPIATIERNDSQKLKEDHEAPRTKPIPKPRNKAGIQRSVSFEGPSPCVAQGVDLPAPMRETRRQNTQAWVDESPPAHKVSTTQSGEKTWTANSKREPETLSQLLQEVDKPLTPYEQKRVQDIKKLNSKVERLAAERTEQEQQVIEMKIQVAEKELDLMDRHMRTKLIVASAQVQDQVAYIKQLLSTEADPALVEQERLVEKQLRRRKDRYERQLEYIAARREQMKQHVEGKTTMTEAQLTSMQDKFGQFRKRDGSLNTRQVFQMLKSEERKQTKAKLQVEQQKIIANANLMEMKELATRQKLRELKEAMSSGKSFLNVSAQNGDEIGESNHSRQKQENLENKSGTSDLHFKKNNLNGGQLLNLSVSEQSELNISSASVPSKEFYAPRKTEKDPTNKWEANYSRPTTPSNLSFQNQNGDVNTSHVDQNESAVSKSEVEELRFVNPGKKTVLTEDDMLEIQSKRFEKELNTSKIQRNNERKNNDQRTYMPSEYVNGISNGDQFDARKMNLSSKNFDSALSSMLGQENNKLLPDDKDYEQYARTSKYRPNPYLESQKATSPLRGVKGQGQRSLKVKDSRSTESFKQEPDYGDDSTVLPKKFRNFRDAQPPRRRDPKPRPRPSSAEEGFDMQRFLMSSTLNTTQNSTIVVDDEDDRPKRVVAMDDQEREKTYMSKAMVERNRVNRIRKARMSAEIIQRAWRRYKARRELQRLRRTKR